MADTKTNTAVAVAPKVRVEAILKDVMEIINTALPSTVKPEQFRDVFLMAAVKEPKIFAADRTSVQQALIQSARSGLMPDGKMAALVPFKNTKENRTEVQFIIMLMGYIHLFKKHGGVHSMAVNVVFENDEFEYIEGDETILRHRPDPFSEDRGEMIGVYGIFKDAEGRVMHREIMGKAAVMKAKAVSKMSGSGPWQQFEEEMWRKTLVRRASKYLPLTDEAQRILDAEDAATIDFDLPNARQARVDYNPMIDAAGLAGNDTVDEDGVVTEGDAPSEEKTSDDTPFDGGKVEENTRQRPARLSEKQLDEAWDIGYGAKERGEPRTPPEGMLEALHDTFYKAWDKATAPAPKEEVKRETESVKTETKDKRAPVQADPDVQRDARSAALDGRDRITPDEIPEEQREHWFRAYDAQVKDAEGA